MLLVKKFDFYLLLPVAILLAFSIGMIASVSPSSILTHIVYVAISIVVFLIFSFVDIEILLSLSPAIYISSVVFLILPFIFGTVTRGSVRWIPIGDYTIQPSEIVKPFLALFSAWYWSKNSFNFKSFRNFVLFFIPILGLIFLQPDLGSTLVVLSIFVGSILISGTKIKQILLLLLSVLFIIPITWFSLKSYQKTRLIHFFDPSLDPLGEGYNQIQAKIAVGSGQLFGWGLGKGPQSHLSFLPERHTDFIFSSFAEEFGFTGSALLLLIYLFMFMKFLKIAQGTKDRTFFTLSMCLFFWIFFQTTVNIGMNIGILPITGITLPMFSYGGSSLVSTMISFGIFESISRRNREEEVISIKHF